MINHAKYLKTSLKIVQYGFGSRLRVCFLGGNLRSDDEFLALFQRDVGSQKVQRQIPKSVLG